VRGQRQGKFTQIRKILLGRAKITNFAEARIQIVNSSKNYQVIIKGGCKTSQLFKKCKPFNQAIFFLASKSRKKIYLKSYTG